MTKYRLWIVDTTKEDTATIMRRPCDYFCDGLQEVFNICGGKLHRYRAGYGGYKGNIEYIALRA